MASATRLCVMLWLPTSSALPGLRSCRESPPSVHAVPLDTGPQPLRAGKAPETARRHSPGRSAEVIHPRVVTCRCLFRTPGVADAARCGPAALRLECRLTPPVVREARDVVRMPVWGRRPVTRVRGGWGPMDTPSPSDGTMHPSGRQRRRCERCIETTKNILVAYLLFNERFLHLLHDPCCATDTPGDCPAVSTPRA